MRKKIASAIIGLSILGNLGAGWPTELDTAIDPTKLVHLDSPRLAPNILKDIGALALVDTHLNELTSLIELPPGWIANGSLWNHHEMLVRTMGLINTEGTEAFILIGAEEVIDKPINSISDDDLLNISESWKKIVETRYPDYKLSESFLGKRLSWQEFPKKLGQSLRAISKDIRDIKRGRIISMYALNKDDDLSIPINVAIVSDFDLFGYERSNGKTYTLMRNRHVKICFVPEGLSLMNSIVEVAKIAIQTEQVCLDWDKKLLQDMKERATCKAKDGKAYSINHLAKESNDFKANPYTIRLNTFNNERVKVPTTATYCWVNEAGGYMFLNKTINPNDLAPLNKMEWKRIY